jgi:hypothetical protein
MSRENLSEKWMSLAQILTAAPLIVCPQSIIIQITSGVAATKTLTVMQAMCLRDQSRTTHVEHVKQAPASVQSHRTSLAQPAQRAMPPGVRVC